MNSSIYIDGAALWVLLIMAAILFIGFIYFGNAYIAEARSNDRLKRENRMLREEVAETVDKLRRETSKNSVMAVGKDVRM